MFQSTILLLIWSSLMFARTGILKDESKRLGVLALKSGLE